MRILVVEDEPELAEAIAAGLRLEGFDVDVALDGLDGLWRAQEHDYAAVLLDILLPGMNGYRVCRALRETKPAVPILMLTAKSGEYDEVEALDAGADDYLTKPFSHVVLAARVRALLRRAGPAGTGSARALPMVLRAGPISLDLATRRCQHGEATVDLTPREFSLLELLLSHPNQVLTRSALRDAVWGTDFTGDSNVVDVYVRYLRRKLDPPEQVSCIETVRGVGYRMLVPS